MDLLQNVLSLFDLRMLLIVALIFIPLERLFSLHAEQKVLRRFWRLDLFYAVFNRVPLLVGLMLVANLIQYVTQLVPQGLRDTVGGSPLWLQVIGVFFVADLGFYAGHRMFHSVPWLWQFHAVHHSIEEMDWLAAGRIHPVDQIVTKGMSMLPLALLGFSAEAILIHSAVFLVQTYVEHANIKLKLGPLTWLIAGPEFHHWHHSKEREAYDKNYAAQLPFLDLLFGTYHMPEGRMPSAYGVDDPVPTNYLTQMAYPFKRIVRMIKRRRARRARALAEAAVSQQ